MKEEWYECRCGNAPHIDGFYPCLPSGHIIEPDADGPWDEISYVCYKCNAIVHIDDDNCGVIVAQASAEACAYNAVYDWGVSAM